MLLFGIGIGMVIGFGVTWWGTWYRLSKIESDLRRVANEAHEYTLFSGGAGNVPAEWVSMQVEEVRRNNFS